jgi:HPP family
MEGMPTDRPATGAPDTAPSPPVLVAALRRVPPSVYGGAVMAVIGALGWACAVPWLFPSLGPTIAIQSEAPEHHSARPYSVVVGHLIGAAVGFAAVRLTGVIHQPPVNVSHALNGARVIAAALAVFASMALQTLARARHAPAQATTLLIVVGALDADLHGAFVLAAGITLVATLGEGVRRLKLAR